MPYAEVNDTRLHIRQQGSGPAALFIHGFPLDSTMWLDQLASLADLRRCVAPDLRGFGMSAPVAAQSLPMEDHAEDLAGVLDLISEEEADIIGLSMGGYVALAFAELYPERVRSLTLIDTRSVGDSDEAKAGRDALAERVVVEGRGAVADTMVSGLLGSAASAHVRARLRSMIESCRYETIVAALAAMRDRPDRSRILESISVPAAVIVGEEDMVTPPSDSEAMASLLPDAAYTLIEGAGHMSPLEQPEAVNRAIRELLLRV